MAKASVVWRDKMKSLIPIMVFASLCLAVAGSCQQQKSGEVRMTSSIKKPPVDLNKPVENPNLVAALSKFEKDQSDSSRQRLFNELKTAVYLIPVLTDNLSTTLPDKEGRATVTKDSRISFFVSNDMNGNPYLPVFTDWQEIGKFTQKKVNTLVMPANDLWAFILKQDRFNGAVLNPGDKALHLDKAMIKALQK
jgi:hypothetical protein